MKSLSESLFDGNLVSKDTGLEYLYGLVEDVSIFSYRAIPYIDSRKVQHDFNRIIKQFPPKDFTGNQYASLKKIRNNPNEETLRQLFYLVVTGIKTMDIPVNKKGYVDGPVFAGLIEDILKRYVSRLSCVHIEAAVNDMYSTRKEFGLVHITFNKSYTEWTDNDDSLESGRIYFTYKKDLWVE